MLIRKKSKLEDLWQALQLRYGDVEPDVDFAGQITHAREGRQELWTMRLPGNQWEAACLTAGNRVNDFHCQCEQFEARQHCKHVYRLVDLAMKQVSQKLHPTQKRRRQSSLQEDLEKTLALAPATDVSFFLHRQARHYEDFSLLLITSQLKFRPDIGEDVHWMRLKSLLSDPRRTLKKEAGLVRHLVEIKRQLEELLRSGDIMGASQLYAAFVRHLLADLYRIGFRDAKAAHLLAWFEQYPASLLHVRMAPDLKAELKQVLGDLLRQSDYLSGSQLQLFCLPADWLPDKQGLAQSVKDAIRGRQHLLDYPGVFFLYSVFCGLPENISVPGDEASLSRWLELSRRLDASFQAHTILFDLISHQTDPCRGFTAYVSEYPLGSGELDYLAHFLMQTFCPSLIEKLRPDERDVLSSRWIRQGHAEGLSRLCQLFNREAEPGWIDEGVPEHWLFLYPILPLADAQRMYNLMRMAIFDFLNQYLGEQNQQKIQSFFELMLRHQKIALAEDLFRDIVEEFSERKTLLDDLRMVLSKAKRSPSFQN
jgi:hypothetical protein